MRHTEDYLQMQCIKWFDLQYPKILRHHSPNGGKRNAREGKRFKNMGTLAGFPDLFIIHGNNLYHGLFIEMKADKGKQQTTQKSFQVKVENIGYKYIVCRSFDEFKREIEKYLGL